MAEGGGVVGDTRLVNGGGGVGIDLMKRNK